MLIPQETLQRVIGELQDIIGQDMEIMDENGIVIASTNRGRIGVLHAGAVHLRDQRLQELLVSEEGEYEGSLPGIVLPLMLDGEVAGAVGLSGDRRNLRKLGRVIQKMAQVLIADSVYQRQNTLKENMRNHFLFSWLFDPETQSDPQVLLRGYALGISLSNLCTAVILEVDVQLETAEGELARQQIRETVFSSVRNQVKARMPRSAWLTVGTHLVFLLEERSMGKLRELFASWKQQMEQAYPVLVAVGIGSPVQEEQEHLLRSYREAELACQVSLRDLDRSVRVFEELLLERLLGNISDGVKRQFLTDLFHSCTAQEVQQSIQVLKAYFTYDGSITKAAESLFIHKNTMQYRLNRIERLTGYNPRKLSDGAVLYFAVASYEAFDQPPILGQR